MHRILRRRHSLQDRVPLRIAFMTPLPLSAMIGGDSARKRWIERSVAVAIRRDALIVEVRP